MEIINFSEQNSIINQYLLELRSKDYQQNALVFRNNVERIGELMAYEISKTLDYSVKSVETPLATAEVSTHDGDIVLSTVFSLTADAQLIPEDFRQGSQRICFGIPIL